MFFSITPQAVIFVAALLLSDTASAQKAPLPEKAELFKDGLRPHVENALKQNLKATQILSIGKWTAGWLPEDCLKEAKYVGVDPKDISVYNIRYTDCDKPWTFCRHSKAQVTLDTMMEYFGRLPVRERSWVRHVMAVPDTSSNAYMRNANTVYKGPVNSLSVFQHETAHAVDHFKNGKEVSSATDAFHKAFEKDTCVPDSYARASWQENYAQVSVLALYDTVVPGGLAKIGADWKCLSNQLKFVKSTMGNEMKPGGKCDRKLEDSKVVSASSKTLREIIAEKFSRRSPFFTPKVVEQNQVDGDDEPEICALGDNE